MISINFKDNGQEYLLDFPEGTTDEEISKILQDQFPKKDEKTSLIQELTMSPYNAIKGAANILLSTPKKVVGVPLVAAGEKIASLKTDEENYNDFFNNDLSLGERFRALRSIGNPYPFERNAIRALGENTEFDESIVKAGRHLSEVTDSMIEAVGFDRPDETVGGVAYDIGSGVGSIALALGLSAISQNTASVGMLFGLMGASDTYEKARVNGVKPEVAFDGATARGFVEGSLEAVGLDIFVNRLKGLSTFKRNALRTIEQVGQEMAQSLGEGIVEKLYKIDDRTFGEMMQEMAYSGAIALVTGAPVSVTFTHLENKGIVGKFREAGFTDQETKIAIGSIVKRQQQDTKDDVVGELELVSDELANSDAVSNMRTSYDEGMMDEWQIGEIGYESPKDTESIVEQYIKGEKLSTRIKESTIKNAEAAVKFFDDTVAPITERVRKIDPSLTKSLREHEFNVKQMITGWSDKAEGFLKKYKKLDKETQARLDIALKNSKVSEIVRITQKNDMVAEYADVKRLFDEMFKRANKSGLDVKFRENYFTRKIKSGKIDEFMETIKGSEGHGVILDAIKDVKDPSERAHIINNMLRGFAFNKIFLGNPGQLKERSIETITAETASFYENSDNALTDYIISVSDAIGAKEFFGKGSKSKESQVVGTLPKKGFVVANVGADGNLYVGDPGDLHFTLNEKYAQKIRNSMSLKSGEATWKGIGFTNETGIFFNREQAFNELQKQNVKLPPEASGGELDSVDLRGELRKGNIIEGDKAKSDEKEGLKDIDSSIGNLVDKIAKEKGLSIQQERDLRSIYTARFNQKGTHGVVAYYKNIEYAATLGNLYTAFTQIGDLYTSIYRNGLKNAVTEYGKAVFGKSDIKMREVGLENIAEEYASRSLAGKAVGKIFQATGLSFIDKLGKESLMNASVNKMKKRLVSGDQKAIEELNAMFGEETEQVIKDIKSGKKSTNVLFYAFNELSDFQPISLSEMPTNYLKGGNLRLFYMLKTYSIKQFSVYRRDAFEKIAQGKKEGYQNLFRLLVTLLAVNVPVEALKDVLKGDDFVLEDAVFDNLWKVVLFSRYRAQKVSRDGLGSSLWQSILPPAKTLDSMWSDFSKAYKGKLYGVEDIKSIRLIPVLGEPVYKLFER